MQYRNPSRSVGQSDGGIRSPTSQFFYIENVHTGASFGQSKWDFSSQLIPLQTPPSYNKVGPTKQSVEGTSINFLLVKFRIRLSIRLSVYSSGLLKSFKVRQRSRKPLQIPQTFEDHSPLVEFRFRKTISSPCGGMRPSPAPGSPPSDRARNRVGGRAASGLVLRPLSPLPVLPSRRELTPDRPSQSAAVGGSTPTSARSGSPAVVVPKLWEPGNTPRPATEPPAAAPA